MFHKYAYAVREVFAWGKDDVGRPLRLMPGQILTDDDCHELEKPENAELLRRCTRIDREHVAHLIDAAAPIQVPPAPTPVAPSLAAVTVSTAASASVKE